MQKDCFGFAPVACHSKNPEVGMRQRFFVWRAERRLFGAVSARALIGES